MIDIATEIFEKSVKDCQNAVYHFIKTNKWFSGKIYLLTTSTKYPSQSSIDSIRKIYSNVEVINTSTAPSEELLSATVEITRSNIWKYCLLLDSYRILYMSNYAVVSHDLSNIITEKSSFISKDFDFIYFNGILDKLSISSTDSDITDFIVKQPNFINLDDILIYSSSIPDRIYASSLNSLKNSSVIIFDTLTANFSSSTRINAVRLHNVRETLSYLTSPSARVIPRPVYTALPKSGKVTSYTDSSDIVHPGTVYHDLGKFKILGSRECLKANDKLSIHIAIPTYNRKSYLHFLLKNIAEYSHQYNISIFIYDDFSPDKYLDTIQLLNSLNVSYTLKQSNVNNGKERYANVYNNIFLDIKESSADYFIQSADDLILVNNFFEKALTQLSQSGQDVLNLLLTHHHVHLFNKIGRPIIKLGELEVYSSSADGAYIAKKKFFDDINYEIPIVSPTRWIKNSLKGSGTSSNILVKYRKPIYQLATESLFIHLGHDSMLNPILRKTEILESIILDPLDQERYNSALIELKKDTAYSIFNNKRVLFIGPSPDILLNRKSFGKFVDSYDIVVRTNGAYPITDNSNILGSKCDVLILNNAFTNSPTFNKNNYINSDIKLIFEFGAVSSKSIDGMPPTQKFNKSSQLSINDTLNISRDIDIKPFSGMLAISEILNNSPKELFVCGVSNYSNLTGTHLPGYLPSTIKEKDVYSRQTKHHPNTANYQYNYFKELLKSNLISMDDFSKKYFE